MECKLSIVINKDYHLSITAAKKHWPEVWTGSTVCTRKNNSQLNSPSLPRMLVCPQMQPRGAIFMMHTNLERLGVLYLASFPGSPGMKWHVAWKGGYPIPGFEHMS